jgi:hypothetical protein
MAAAKTLMGKYQVRDNMHVICSLEVVDAKDGEFRTFIGIRRTSDVTVPIGTRIYLNADSIHKITARRTNVYDVYFVTVIGHEEIEGRPLHICEPLNKDTHPDLREVPRVSLDLPTWVTLGDDGDRILFQVVNGTTSGFTLAYRSNHVLLGGIHLEEAYTFWVPYKDKEYDFMAFVKHIQYNWRTHEHRIGIEFCEMDSDHEVVLNLLIDPNYKIDITHTETIDPLTGKVMKD